MKKRQQKARLRTSVRFLAAAGLALLVIAAFSPVVKNSFVSFDDNVYIVDNPPVREGLTFEGLRWAVTSSHTGNWHPITWLSHMLDVSLFGLQPWGHHLTGMLLHTTTALLTMTVLHRMTGAFWPSLLAAALFAVHPLRVESVAWAAERKDLLSGLFWMLALGAYLRYVRSPDPRRLILVVIALAAGLLCKPMAVTLPFALLILDWWPLGRLRINAEARAGISFQALLREKSPLFLISALSAAVTLNVQSLGGATTALPHLSLGVRLANATVAYASYVGTTFWPTRLSVFYPHPEAYWPWTVIAVAAAVLATLSFVAGFLRRRAPAVAAGWLWFLGTLVPVIGVVQAGYQAWADRYTYLPSLGLAVALAWGARSLVRSRSAALVFTVLALPLCLSLTLATRHQVSLWHDNRTLFGHALEIDGINWLAHMNIGASLAAEGRFMEAIPHYRAALRFRPAQALNNLGVAYFRLGRAEEGLELLRRALVVDPLYSEAHYNLGVALAESGNIEEADGHLLAVLQREPGHRDALYNLGVLAGQGNRLQEAEQYYRRALAVDPRFAAAHLNLGVALARLGRASEAELEQREAIRLDPKNDAARHNLSGLHGTEPFRVAPAPPAPR